MKLLKAKKTPKAQASFKKKKIMPLMSKLRKLRDQINTLENQKTFMEKTKINLEGIGDQRDLAKVLGEANIVMKNHQQEMEDA